MTPDLQNLLTDAARKASAAVSDAYSGDRPYSISKIFIEFATPLVEKIEELATQQAKALKLAERRIKELEAEVEAIRLEMKEERDGA